MLQRRGEGLAFPSMRLSPATASTSAEVHPPEMRLVRFMRCELSQREVDPVVRHLLAGCPQCLEVTRRLWALGEAPPGRGRGGQG